MKKSLAEASLVEVRSEIDRFKKSPEFLNLAGGWLDRPDLIAALVQLAGSDEAYPFPQYASHILLHMAWEQPSVLSSHYEPILDTVLSTENPSVRRNLLGVVHAFEDMEYREGELLDWLLAMLADPDQKPGIVNYSVHKLGQYIQKYPELLPEIKAAIALREEMGVGTGLMQWAERALLSPKKAVKKRRKPGRPSLSRRDTD